MFSASKKNPCYFCDFCDICGHFGVLFGFFFSKSCFLLDLLFLRFLRYCKWFSYIIFSQLFLWRQLRKKFASKFLLTRSILDISELYSLMLVVVALFSYITNLICVAFVHFVSGLKTSSSDNEDCGRLDQNQSGKLLNEHFNYSYWFSVFLVNTDIILVVAAIKITTYFVFFRHSWQFSGCPYWERSQRCL